MPKTLRNPEQVAANQLVNAGIAVRSKSGGVALSEDAHFSLQLDGPAETLTPARAAS